MIITTIIIIIIIILLITIISIMMIIINDACCHDHLPWGLVDILHRLRLWQPGHPALGRQSKFLLITILKSILFLCYKINTISISYNQFHSYNLKTQCILFLYQKINTVSISKINTISSGSSLHNNVRSSCLK